MARFADNYPSQRQSTRVMVSQRVIALGVAFYCEVLLCRDCGTRGPNSHAEGKTIQDSQSEDALIDNLQPLGKLIHQHLLTILMARQ